MMKINSTFHVLTFLMTGLIFSVPFVTFAHQKSGRGGSEVAAAQDVQAVVLEAKAAAERDANNDFGTFQAQWCIVGGAFVVTLSAIGSALLGCWVGEALDPPRHLLHDPSVDPEGAGSPCAVISTGMIYGCLGGWGLGFTGSIYGIYKSSPVPSERLIGKSPAYIEVYTKTYKRKIGLKRATTAAVGSVMLHGLLLIRDF